MSFKNIIIPENVEKEIKPIEQEYGCKKCDNSGFVTVVKDGLSYSDYCDCYKQIQSKKRKERCNIPDLYMDAEFNLDPKIQFIRFKPLKYENIVQKENGLERNKRILQFTKSDTLNPNKFGAEYVRVVGADLDSPMRKRAVGLILSGLVGSGKTTLACAIANEFIEKGYNVTYLKAKQYLDDVVKGCFGRDESAVKMQKKKESLNGANKEFKENCHILVLDELGFEYQKADSGFALSEIKDLLRNRAERLLPTIITTNFLPDDLSVIYEEELVSMFAQSYMIYFMNCPDDHRIKKSAELDLGFDFDNLRD